MRMTRYHLFLLGFLVLSIIGSVAYTQFRGPGGGGPGGGGGMAEAAFARYSGGADTFDVNTAKLFDQSFFGGDTVEKQKEKMLTFLQKKGKTGSTMTKDIFLEYSTESMREIGKRKSEESFTKMSGGKDSFNVDTIELPKEMTWREPAETQKTKMKEFLTTKNVTTGLMTKELYTEYRDFRTNEWRAKNEEQKKDGDKKSSDDPDARAKKGFQDMDKNGDGKIDLQEMEASRGRSRLHDEREKWDTNKNGSIELTEYLAYYANRYPPRGSDKGKDGTANGGWAPSVPGTAKVEAEAPVVVWRFGKLPKELPEWFVKLDKDEDGQVGLYEWKKDARPLGEFIKMDLNSDGFITAEEILRYNRLEAAAKANSSTSNSTVRAAVLSPITTTIEKSKGGNTGGVGGPPSRGFGMGMGKGKGKSKGPESNEGSTRSEGSSESKRPPKGKPR